MDTSERKLTGRVAVWDTYVKRKTGAVMHFDIVVAEEEKNANVIYNYGKEYLKQKGEEHGTLDTEECRYCHIEDPTPEMTEEIKKKGYFIIEMEEISEQLPQNATRRDMILHLRAHYLQYRFADFKGKSEAEVRSLLNNKS